MNPAGPKTMVIGYGNPGRLDDGLGPALAARLATMDLPHVTVETGYHLTIEDAEGVARHDMAIFADAAVSGPEPFEFRRIEPKRVTSFSTHGVEPQAVLSLAHEVFGSNTVGYVLAIRGYAFDGFSEQLSQTARDNLDAALKHLTSLFARGLEQQRCRKPVPESSDIRQEVQP